MISDADGKQYPWYGSKTEVQTLEGPTMQPTHVTIHMNDNFFPQVRCHRLFSYLLLVRLMGQYRFARWRLSSVVVCNAAGGRAGRSPGAWAVGCTASQYGYVPLERHLV